MLAWDYTCQNSPLLEITCRGSIIHLNNDITILYNKGFSIFFVNRLGNRRKISKPGAMPHSAYSLFAEELARGFQMASDTLQASPLTVFVQWKRATFWKAKDVSIYEFDISFSCSIKQKYMYIQCLMGISVLS